MSVLEAASRAALSCRRRSLVNQYKVRNLLIPYSRRFMDVTHDFTSLLRIRIARSWASLDAFGAPFGLAVRQLYLDAPVLLQGFLRDTFRNREELAKACCHHAVLWHALIRQVANHGYGAGGGELPVGRELQRVDGYQIRMAVNAQNPVEIGRDGLDHFEQYPRQFIEFLFAFIAQLGRAGSEQ